MATANQDPSDKSTQYNTCKEKVKTFVEEWSNNFKMCYCPCKINKYGMMDSDDTDNETPTRGDDEEDTHKMEQHTVTQSNLEDSSTHSESDASITQDPPEEATFAPTEQPPSPIEEPKESDLEDNNTHSESDASITQDPPEEATFAPAKQPPSPIEEPKESDLDDNNTHSESDASITQDPPEEATFAPAKQPPSPVEEPKGFFSQTDRVSFSDLAPQTTSGFVTTTPGFQFQGAGKQLFAVRSADYGETNPEEEIDINFKPLVSPPKVAPTKSWDDEAGTLFTNRGKLFRFDDSINQWKERGVGDIKILQHAETGRCRILMRRDQILKICCNHNITAEMTLLPGNTDKSWVWFTQSDFTDEEPKKEKLAVRFKHVETAREFKEVFEQCVKRDTE
ncbi:E3 SUMO-protein ligase RanBP2-like isoform X1 [Halichondria panicea]|uniref:E3 SUMO-protein ligase RanBP2-like isoform X1 n=1 Tax=Halichondria panicea TaxID=6063 RepID=UPI00312B6D1C